MKDVQVLELGTVLGRVIVAHEVTIPPASR